MKYGKKFGAMLGVVMVSLALALVGGASAATPGQSNALRSAKQYLQVSSFSRSGLIQQLEFDGFTLAQATYGVGRAGL